MLVISFSSNRKGLGVAGGRWVINLPELSQWARERFGDFAHPLRDIIPLGLQAAHLRALAAHQGLGLESNEAYGLIWRAQHEELVTRVRPIGGVRIIKPKRARYELAMLGEQNVILYPWRFSDDSRRRLTDARMKLSEVRRNLLALTSDMPSRQMTIEQAGMSEEELAADWEETQRNIKEMLSAGRLVLIAYASNPHAGILRAYWGDASQADEDGRLCWTYQEELPLDGLAQGDGGTGSVPVRPVPPSEGPDSTAGGRPRFDEAPLEEPVLGVRPPLTSPESDPTEPQPETGSDA